MIVQCCQEIQKFKAKPEIMPILLHAFPPCAISSKQVCLI